MQCRRILAIGVYPVTVSHTNSSREELVVVASETDGLGMRSMVLPEREGQTKVFGCWSGGKDGCLALHRAKAAGYMPAMLLTLVDEHAMASRSHGLSVEVLRAQAQCIGLELVIGPVPRGDAAGAFEKMAATAVGEGCRLGIFGDIFVEEHREWIKKMAEKSGFRPLFPLWGGNTSQLAREFIAAGFRAVVVSVSKGLPCEVFLGADLDESLIAALERRGVDPCGENGEYHTLVYDGPLFAEPLRFSVGRVVDTGKTLNLEVHALPK